MILQLFGWLFFHFSFKMFLYYFLDVGIALFAEDNVAIRFLPIAAMWTSDLFHYFLARFPVNGFSEFVHIGRTL